MQLIECKSPILDVGAGTGQMTLPLIEKGLNVTALEPGLEMAGILREKGIRVIDLPFEKYDGNHTWGAVVSHQAFHWIEREKGIKAAGQALKEDGILLLIWDIDCSQDTPFYKATQPVYRVSMPKAKWPSKKPVCDFPGLYAEAMEESPFFGDVHLEYIQHSREYNKEEYIGLLRTFSDHLSMPDAFFEGIERIIDDFGGVIERRYKSALLWSTKECESVKGIGLF